MKYPHFQELISRELAELAKTLPPSKRGNGRRPKNNLRKLAERLVRKRFNQINVCMFDTPDRSADLRTFHSPVRITINAVLLTEDQGRIATLRANLEKVLLGLDNQFEEYLPIALNPEVGYLY